MSSWCPSPEQMESAEVCGRTWVRLPWVLLGFPGWLQVVMGVPKAHCAVQGHPLGTGRDPKGRIMWCGFLERVSTTRLRHGSAGMVLWGSAELCPFIFPQNPIPVLGDLPLHRPAESQRAETGLGRARVNPCCSAQVRAFLGPTGLSPSAGCWTQAGLLLSSSLSHGSAHGPTASCPP